jgi:Domain of unknown function (DUF4411)
MRAQNSFRIEIFVHVREIAARNCCTAPKMDASARDHGTRVQVRVSFSAGCRPRAPVPSEHVKMERG